MMFDSHWLNVHTHIMLRTLFVKIAEIMYVCKNFNHVILPNSHLSIYILIFIVHIDVILKSSQL